MPRPLVRLVIVFLALATLGCDTVFVFYSHTQNIESWEWATEWYAEDSDGTLVGPFDSGGTGIVEIGPVSGAAVHLTRKVSGFRYTTMGAKVEAISYYTGSTELPTSIGYVTPVLDNAILDDELMIFYPFVNWWTIDQTPYSLTQSFAWEDVVANDGSVDVFVSYRSDSSEEPASRYDFRLGLDPSELGNVRFDVQTLRTRSARAWQSSADLSTDEPYLVALRKGNLLLVGDSQVDLSGTTGSFGLPADFPAERWYLVSGSVGEPEIVREFDPASPDPVALEPLSGFIDDTTIAVDPVQETFSVDVPGMGDVDFGVLVLTHGAGFWEIAFSGELLQRSGDTLTLALPEFAGGALPTFSSARISLYRLDDATSDEMLRHRWHKRSYRPPSYAMQSEHEFL